MLARAQDGKTALDLAGDYREIAEAIRGKATIVCRSENCGNRLAASTSTSEDARSTTCPACNAVVCRLCGVPCPADSAAGGNTHKC